jgi:hypothetical protein
MRQRSVCGARRGRQPHAPQRPGRRTPPAPTPNPAGERLLVVSHGGALHAVHRRARGYMAPSRVANCSVSVLRIDPPQPQPAPRGEEAQRQAPERQQAAGKATEAAEAAACSGPGGCNGPGGCGPAAPRAPRPQAAQWALLSWNEPLGVGEGGAAAADSFGGGAREG